MRRLIGCLLSSAVILMLLAACQPHQYTATLIDPPLPVTDFTLNTADGVEFRLSEHQDKLLVAFFGYTHCPDVCPLTMLQLQKAVAALGSQADRLEVAMITVDPERDTPEVLGAFVKGFHESFIGLRTDDPEVLKAIAVGLGIAYEQIGEAGSDAQKVAHTSSILVIDRMGLIALFPPDTHGEAMAADLKELLRTH
jgi:protein SCO1/2